MKNPRKYGKSPFSIAVIHGGPGAPGEMAPVARELSTLFGVLEPLQTAASLERQVEELYDILQKNGYMPVTLIGWSWGAMLGFITAARHPSVVKRLILVGSAVFEKKYAADITKTRLSRLSGKDKNEVRELSGILNNPSSGNKDTLMLRLGKLLSGADSYDPILHKDEILECRYHIFRSVWEDAQMLRDSGKLLELGKQIKCPVTAIHGDYDPHPAAGIRKPLERVLEDFKFILIEKCGHYPWFEKSARDRFYRILKKELR